MGIYSYIIYKLSVNRIQRHQVHEYPGTDFVYRETILYEIDKSETIFLGLLY